MKSLQSIPNLTFTVQVFRDGKLFVAYNPELDVSTCGKTVDEAKYNIRDALRGFLIAAQRKGTLADILEEAGYTKRRQEWHDPELMSLDRVTLV
jgi:predicted RNase H-like HicB family nuclease